MLMKVGTPDVGLASPVGARVAQDTSTVFTNPAGMTRLAGSLDYAWSAGCSEWQLTDSAIRLRHILRPGHG